MYYLYHEKRGAYLSMPIHLNTVLPYMGENSLIENEATRPAGKRGDGAAVCYHFHI